ncbi:MAG: hypothetical protein HRU25_13380 [Psychrobium sp.]|nr:hypothetical protein [Psychrobium sp.]
MDFLKRDYQDGLIEISETTLNGVTSVNVVGTDTSEYSAKALYILSGTRVMKDHDNRDNDHHFLLNSRT